MRLLLFLSLQSIVVLLTACGERSSTPDHAPLSREDSLSDLYLDLQDSLHQTWNIMISDDNEKLHHIRNLIAELASLHPDENEKYAEWEERLSQLSRMRYTEKSMSNADVIEEYDFASNSLLIEILAETESSPEFATNPTLQSLADNIVLADQRIMNYRFAYDSIANSYNTFLDANKDFLRELDHTLSLEKKPQFQMVADE